jgi:hypothetical protein
MAGFTDQVKLIIVMPIMIKTMPSQRLKLTRSFKTNLEATAINT